MACEQEICFAVQSNCNEGWESEAEQLGREQMLEDGGGGAVEVCAETRASAIPPCLCYFNLSC